MCAKPYFSTMPPAHCGCDQARCDGSDGTRKTTHNDRQCGRIPCRPDEAHFRQWARNRGDPPAQRRAPRRHEPLPPQGSTHLPRHCGWRVELHGAWRTHARQESSTLVCPWHGFEFDLETGKEVCWRRPASLRMYRVEEIDSEVSSRCERAAGLPDYRKPAGNPPP